MDLVEFQGKQYFRRFGIPVSAGEVASTKDEVLAVARGLGYPVVIKAQVPVGGRGKAGGVKIASDEKEAAEIAEAILGMEIKGHKVRRVLVEKASEISHEYYLSITLDRGARMHLLMFSTRGGVDIEEVARQSPEAIARLHIDPTRGITRESVEAAFAGVGLEKEKFSDFWPVIEAAYRCYLEGDATLVEINPLITTVDGEVRALDSKVSLDEDARFRHPEWEEFEDFAETDEREARAKELGLNYVGLAGFVGIIANGAGLAMSTCDVVAQVGGAPANFLDIGGGANEEVMARALELLASDPQVKSILVNIFGGIVRCDEVARGILKARERVDIGVPVVVRLDGTNAPQARELLTPHLGENLLYEPTMMAAARKAVEVAQASTGGGK